MHEVSDGVIWPNLVPNPAAGNYETFPDTNITEVSEDDFCMEVHGDEEWVWDYENSGGDTVRSDERAVTEQKDGG